MRKRAECWSRKIMNDTTLKKGKKVDGVDEQFMPRFSFH